MSERSYLFKLFSDDYFRLINQTGVRQRVGLCGITHGGCWDNLLAPDGTYYFSPSDESGTGKHTRLVAYDYDTDSAKICVYPERVTVSRVREQPMTKFHESLTVLPDGRIFMTTHTTDRAPHQPEWMPMALSTHIWEGFPGSHMFVYDPKTGAVENWGIPVPRETIYGATYDSVKNCIYMIGFMRGHVYCFNLDDRSLKDLGKAAEIFCYRLHVGPDKHIYAMTKSGYLWRINVETQKLEDLNWRLPEFEGNYCNNTWYRYMSYAVDLNDHEMIFCGFCSDDFYIYDCNTMQVRSIGKKFPTDELIDAYPVTKACNEFALDKDGVIWYPMTTYSFQKPDDDFRKYSFSDYLVRWDFQNGKAPEVLGMIGGIDHSHGQTSGIKIDKDRDLLYMVDSGGVANVGLSVIAIDLAVFRQHMYEPGPLAQDPRMHPVDMNEEEIERFKRRSRAGEEVTDRNPFQAFPIEDVTPVRLWRSVPHTNIEDSKVIGLVWDCDNVLHGICGENTRYCFKVIDGKVAEIQPLDEAEMGYRAWLEANILPRPFNAEDIKVKMPHVTGRQWLSDPTALTEWNGGRKIVGTNDGLLGIINAAGDKIFNLGNAAPYGPIRSLCTNADKTRLWGTAGDKEMLGIVFCFDDEGGVQQLGMLSYNTHGYMDGPSASNILSAVAVNADESLIAVGGADRIGSIHIAKLK
ncbi:MAG: hypothetical protein IKM07_03880 [Clostridia bacterium]|nr:hypothetical protein [Clostridia bacterium]